MTYVDKGFEELMQKIDQKREEMKASLSEKYALEDLKFAQKEKQLEENGEEIRSIEMIYEELNTFMHSQHDAKVLTKINDIGAFLNKSVEDLEGINKRKSIDKAKTLIDASLKPMNLNIEKAFELISKFNMVPTSVKKPPPVPH